MRNRTSILGVTVLAAWALLALGAALLALARPVRAAGAQIVINEVLADPGSIVDANGDGVFSSTDDEFVEFVNVSGGALDISGWTVSDGFGNRHTFDAGTVVPDNCSVVLFSGGTPTGSFGNSVVNTASTGALGLNNSGDTISLFDDGALLVATLTYAGEGNDDQSITRDPDITGGEPLVKHTLATGSGGTRHSAGTQIDGTFFGGCASSADVAISKSGPGGASPGDVIDYVLVGSNLGSLTAADVVIVDTLPTGVTAVNVDASALVTVTSLTPPTIELGALGPNSSVVVTLSAEIGLSVFGTITNTATITTSTPGDVPGNNSASAVTSVTDYNVVINELLADPDSTTGDANGDGIVNTTDDEFVEIVNAGNDPLDITDWTLRDGFGLRHVFTTTVVAPGCSVVIFAGGTPTGEFGGSHVDTASTGSLGLNNSGDTITVLDSADTIVASYTYGSEGNDNQSLTRSPDITGPEPLVKHSTVISGTQFSPGTTVDGTPFAGCGDPEPTDTVYVSMDSAGSVGSVSYSAGDILRYEQAAWSVHFDAAAAGLGSADIDAFLFYQGDKIVLSFAAATSVPGIGTVEPADLVLYTPGTGQFTFAFDGSDVGLTTADENIDAIAIVGNKLGVSTSGPFSVPGVNGDDEDVILFTATTFGNNTTGTWALYFDGSDIGLGGADERDIWGIWSNGNDLYVTTAGSFMLQGLAIDGFDIARCALTATGSTTACAVPGSGIYWRGDDAGLSGGSVDGFTLALLDGQAPARLRALDALLR